MQQGHCAGVCAGVCSPGGGWKSALLDIAGAPGGWDRCLYTHICACFAAGDLAQRTGGSYAVDCALGLFGCVYCIHGVCWGMTRHRLRAQQGIPGNPVTDCCCATWLPCCVLSQALNHLDLLESQSALSVHSTPAQRAAAAAIIPTEVRAFSGRSRRLSDTAAAPRSRRSSDTALAATAEAASAAGAGK